MSSYVSKKMTVINNSIGAYPNPDGTINDQSIQDPVRKFFQKYWASPRFGTKIDIL